MAPSRAACWLPVLDRGTTGAISQFGGKLVINTTDMNHLEIDRILAQLRDANGLTLVPLSLYFRDGWAMVELGLARGLKSYDKRQVLAERDARREIAREMGRRRKRTGV